MVTSSWGKQDTGKGLNHMAKCGLKAKAVTCIWVDLLIGAYLIITKNQLNKINPYMGQ